MLIFLLAGFIFRLANLFQRWLTVCNAGRFCIYDDRFIRTDTSAVHLMICVHRICIKHFRHLSLFLFLWNDLFLRVWILEFRISI